MWFKVLVYRLTQAYYDLRHACGGTQVLLTDPRWQDLLGDPIPLEDYGDF